MKSKMKNKVIAFAMSLAMVFTMMPIMGAPVYADDPAPAAIYLANGEAPNIEGGQTSSIWFGDYKQSPDGSGDYNKDPIKWRVLSNENGELFLLSDQNLDCKKYNNTYTSITWKNSTLRSWLNNDFINTAYTDNEKVAIKETDDHIFLLSIDEAEEEAYGFTNNANSTPTRGAKNTDYVKRLGAYTEPSGEYAGNGGWWLRSSGSIKDGAIVTYSGFIHHNGYVDGTAGVRPAFNLNLLSVIFTSAADRGKSSGDVGAGSLKSVEPNSNNEWKLTLKSDHDSFKVEDVSTCDGKTLNIEYSDAVAKKGEYISAIVTDENDAVKYYGNLIKFDDGDSTSGTANVTIDGKMESTDKLYVFNEQLNGDKKTDYASKLIEITVPATAEHNYLWEYVNDGEHKGVCDKCGEEITEKHTYNQGRCTVCNGACGHSSLSDSYGNNSEWHWKECEYCLLKFYEDNHAWQDEWTADGVQHWHECEVCQRKKDEAAHSGGTATCTEKAKCEVCNVEYGDLGEHKYSAWKNLDATQHQRVCANDKTHVEKASHSWDAGKVTKKATEKQTGIKTYTCKSCKATKTETIPKLKPSAPKVSGTPLAKLTAKKKSITISWNKIQGAAGYDIFFARCNHDNKKIVTKKVKTIKGNKTFKWTKSGLKKGTAYKAYVRAYVYKNGKKTYVRNSPLIHAYTGNGTKNYTNAKSVSVNKTKVTLKKGKTFKIKAKVNKVNKKKKLMSKSHALTLRYMTSNSKIASVNSGGKVTAKGKGTCYIYVYAHNGVSKQIKVRVGL
ncbi:MAG: Ig-like domain-containing protein [Firmicutes bacterium]|nr:Ig-like domain-containing protein [Bacillota bacterium]